MSFQVVVDTSLRSRSGKLLSDHQSWEFTTTGAPLPEFSQVLLRGYLEALAHDSMRGRGSGTEDERRAASYIEAFFWANDLVVPPDGSLQTFEAYSEKEGRTVESLNVLSTVPGSGSFADEWIVVGAHFDHVGIGGLLDGSWEIHNGADDNASGTALLLEMARIYGAYAAAGGMAGRDRRSVLFAAFGAEEVGLLGSCHYAGVAPVVPISATTAMINLDMVGRLRDGVLEVRRNLSSPDWTPLVENANRPGLLLYEPPGFCEGCSDFACFKEQGVPFIWFFTGAHPDYHTPADDVELINFQGLADVGEVGLRTLVRLATKKDPMR
jgi:Zn-dependent M28 family amino/carboxypeptidase